MESGRSEEAGCWWFPSAGAAAWLRSLACLSSASCSQWKLQGTVGRKGVALSPGLPSAGVGGAQLGSRGRGRRCNPKAAGRYLVLVVGAQAVPGLRVVLSVPAVETGVGGGVVRVSSLGARTPEPKGTHKVCAPIPAPSILPGDGGVCISQKLRAEGALSWSLTSEARRLSPLSAWGQVADLTAWPEDSHLFGTTLG